MGWDIAPAADLVTQDFGCVDYAGEWVCPGCGTGHFHAGVDLGSTAGGQSIFRTPVLATRAGTVSAIGIQYLGDQAVAVATDSGVTIEHGHLDQATVSVGQRVNPGDQLGLLGTKGSSTAPHLHIEVRVDGPFQGVSGCPQNDPTRDPMPYLNKVSNMIAGLDSSGFRPTPQIAQAARAAGVQLWNGYLATKPGVGLGSPWDRQSFDAARLCGGKPIAFVSGWDDPGACRKLAEEWNVRLCLDVESGIRALEASAQVRTTHDDALQRRTIGNWVQPWIDAAGRDFCGLYGNYWVFAGVTAAFYIVGGYPGADPNATWGYVARPSGPCGWQWQGTHDEFGGGVDRGWYDPWFAEGGQIEEDEMSMGKLVQGDQRSNVWHIMGNTKRYVSSLIELTCLLKSCKQGWPEQWPQGVVDRFGRILELPYDLGPTGLKSYDDVIFGVATPAHAQLAATAAPPAQLWAPSPDELKKASEVAGLPDEEYAKRLAELTKA